MIELIERKAAGEEIAVQPQAEEPAAAPDLMAALEASLAAVQGELDGARWWSRHFDDEHPEDFVVATEARPVREIALEVLGRAGWLA